MAGKLDLYIARKCTYGEPESSGCTPSLKCSKPCVNCLAFLKKTGVFKNIIYINDQGRWEKEKIKNMTTSHISRGYRNYNG
jgi:hypothetical protein